MGATKQKQYENVISFRLPNGGLSDDEFFEFCQQNELLHFERDAEKNIYVMVPTGSDTGYRNAEFGTELGIWNRKHKLGRTFDSSTGFKMPTGADYSPDAAWMSHAKWDVLTAEEKEKFAPAVPEFIAEIRSKNDDLEYLKDKIQEFIRCGAQLAWLIDPYLRRTIVFKADGEIQTIPFHQRVVGGDVLPGFEVIFENLFD